MERQQLFKSHPVHFGLGCIVLGRAIELINTMIQGSGSTTLEGLLGSERSKGRRYLINLIPIYSPTYSYQTGTLSSVTAFCNEYKREKIG